MRGEIGVTVSAGVANGKMVAKIASDSCKPDGLAIVEPGTEAAFLAPQPVGRLWGVGPKAQKRLAEAGVTTIGEFAGLDDARLFSVFGRTGKRLRELAQGIDDRIVSDEREAVSVSTEETFEFDVREHAKLLEVLREQADEISAAPSPSRRARLIGGREAQTVQLQDYEPPNAPRRADR